MTQKDREHVHAMLTEWFPAFILLAFDQDGEVTSMHQYEKSVECYALCDLLRDKLNRYRSAPEIWVRNAPDEEEEADAWKQTD